MSSNTKNSTKINNAIGSMGWQITVFIMVLYGTVYDNSIAHYMLYAYSALIALAIISYIVIILCPKTELSESEIHKVMYHETTMGKVFRRICSLFSVIEIILLFTHGWGYLAIAWIVAEVVQHIGRRNLLVAANAQVGTKTAVQVELEKLYAMLNRIDNELKKVKENSPENLRLLALKDETVEKISDTILASLK